MLVGNLREGEEGVELIGCGRTRDLNIFDSSSFILEWLDDFGMMKQRRVCDEQRNMVALESAIITSGAMGPWPSRDVSYIPELETRLLACMDGVMYTGSEVQRVVAARRGYLRRTLGMTSGT